MNLCTSLFDFIMSNIPVEHRFTPMHIPDVLFYKGKTIFRIKEGSEKEALLQAFFLLTENTEPDIKELAKRFIILYGRS